MEKGNQVLHTLSRKLSLPQELLPGEPLLELKGNTELSIQNHRGILGYETDCVCVGTARGCVRVCGSGLRVYRMNREQIVIYGQIARLELTEQTI